MRRLPLTVAALGLLLGSLSPAVAKQPPHPPGHTASAPTGLTATVLATSVGLRWGGVADGTRSLAVTRNGSTLATLPPSARTYEDRAVATGATYAYTVVATVTWGEGHGKGEKHWTSTAASNVARVTLPNYKVGAAAYVI